LRGGGKSSLSAQKQPSWRAAAGAAANLPSGLRGAARGLVRSFALTSAHGSFMPTVVTWRTLKRRRHPIRELPIQPTLQESIASQFSKPQGRSCRAEQRLWTVSRTTAWRIHQGCEEERQACPRGLRHGSASRNHTIRRLLLRFLRVEFETLNEFGRSGTIRAFFSALVGPRSYP
jgi:hypothetical protein